MRSRSNPLETTKRRAARLMELLYVIDGRSAEMTKKRFFSSSISGATMEEGENPRSGDFWDFGIFANILTNPVNHF